MSNEQSNPIFKAQGLILKIYLKGVLGPSVEQPGIIGRERFPHQKAENGKYFDWHEMDVYGHTDRPVKECFKKTVLSREALRYMVDNRPTTGEWNQYGSQKELKALEGRWRQMPADDRIKVHLERFDQGYGIAWDIL